MRRRAKSRIRVDADGLWGDLAEPALRLSGCTRALVPDRLTIVRSTSGRSRYDEGRVPRADDLDLDAEPSNPAGRYLAAVPDRGV